MKWVNTTFFSVLIQKYAIRFKISVVKKQVKVLAIKFNSYYSSLQFSIMQFDRIKNSSTQFVRTNFQFSSSKLVFGSVQFLTLQFIMSIPSLQPVSLSNLC